MFSGPDKEQTQTKQKMYINEQIKQVNNQKGEKDGKKGLISIYAIES